MLVEDWFARHSTLARRRAGGGKGGGTSGEMQRTAYWLTRAIDRFSGGFCVSVPDNFRE